MAGIRVRRGGAAVLGSLILTGGLLGVGLTGASAAPSGPNTTIGTFTCPGGVTGTFDAPGNNGKNATDFSSAHLTFDAGGQGIFVPTMLDLTFSVNGVPMGSQMATKGSAQGSVTCSIFSSGPIPGGGTFTLSGTVTGNIITNG